MNSRAPGILMPRTDSNPSPGCPPFRAFCFDSLGLIKVLESPAGKGHPQVVARWGDPDPRRAVLSASLSSDAFPVLAVARRDHTVELLDPCNGASCAEVSVSTASTEEMKSTSSAMVGVHLFGADNMGVRTILTCTEEGDATLQHIDLEETMPGGCHSIVHNGFNKLPERWRVCSAGSILCLRVDGSEKYAAAGGSGVDVNLWNLENHSKIWEAKAPQRDSTGLWLRPFVTAAAFLEKDHRKLVVGTGHHQIRLYDVCAQRRPVLAVDFLESPIKAVEVNSDGYMIFVGTGNGELASFDMRTGKMLGAFKGKCSGSVRSIARHPELPLIATCGLDRYVRVFHVETRQLLTKVFLKQQLAAVVFDSKYSAADPSRSNPAVVKGVTDNGEVAEKDTQVIPGGIACTKKPKRPRQREKMYETGFNSSHQENLDQARENSCVKRRKKVKQMKERKKERKDA